MLVSAELAKEKLAQLAFDQQSDSTGYGESHTDGWNSACVQIAMLIRNTDLTDCQQPPERGGDRAETTTENPKSWIAWKRRAEELEAQLSIAPAADQGSVRTATDRDVSMEDMEQHMDKLAIAVAMRERCAKVCEAQIRDYDYLFKHGHLDTMDQAASNCAAAIRALPDQKD